MTNKMREFFRLAWLPLVVPTCFVVLIWSQSQIDLVWLVRPLVVATLGMLAITLLTTALAGSVASGIVAATAVGIGLTVDDSRRTAIALCVAALAVIGGRLRPLDRGRYLPPIFAAVKVFAACMIVVTLAGTLISGSMPAAVSSLRLGSQHVGPAVAATLASSDVWVILLDGYPGDDAVAGLAPAWDREAFPLALERRGFDVQRNSRTDYLLTQLVLPSMFTGRLLTDVMPSVGGSLAVQSRALREQLDDAPVLHALGEAGYERIAISSGWAELGPRRVDRLFDPPQINEFEVTLARWSYVGTIVDTVLPDTLSDAVRARIEWTFAAAESLAAEDPASPRFVFVHVPAPHAPIVVDAAGGPVNGAPGSSMASSTTDSLASPEAIRMQLDQAEYIAVRATQLVDTIQAAASRPPIVIVFSDHGTGIRWDPDDPLAGGINERSSNLLAAATPGHPKLLPPGTRPVNVLVRVLNAYGIATLPVQPDATWSYRSSADILDLVQVDPVSGRIK